MGARGRSLWMAASKNNSEKDPNSHRKILDVLFSRVQILQSHTDVIVIRTKAQHSGILISQTATHSERPLDGVSAPLSAAGSKSCMQGIKARSATCSCRAAGPAYY